MDRERRPATPGKITHLSVEERVARGKAARNEVPRSSHARWEPATDRPDPVSLLEEQASSRVPELVPLRYGRMLVSPFTFYRGAALIMAADLAATPRSGLTTQICGDAHLSNFGVFASPERHTMFDINDFDETLPGPWEWDVKRLAASFEIAGRDRGFTPADRRAVVAAGVAEYRIRMDQLAAARNLDVWYAHIEVEELLQADEVEHDKEAAGQGREERGQSEDPRQHAGVLQAHPRGRRTTPDHRGPPADCPDRRRSGRCSHRAGPRRKAARPDHGPTGGPSRPTAVTCSRTSSTSTPPARSSVSAASAPAPGSCCMLGRDGEDPLFLQAKEAQESVLERFVGKSKYANHGQRVVAGQRLMQATSDIFLGWQRVTGFDGQVRDFYVRQLRDWKGSADVDTMRTSQMTFYARLFSDARPCPRPLRRPDRHRLLPGQERPVRRRHRRLRRRLRRPERTRLPGPP